MSCVYVLIGTVFVLGAAHETNLKEGFLTSPNHQKGGVEKFISRRSVSSSTRGPCSTPDTIFTSRVNTTDRLRRLRLRMKASSYDAYIVPTSDEHQSEFVAPHDKRREFISGFTGSAGTGVVLSKHAALWTDGRYFIQAEKELDCNWLLMKRYEKGTPSVHEWIIQNLEAGGKVGVDPKVLEYYKWEHLKNELEKSNLTLSEDSSNLIDDIWNIPQGRVPESVARVFVHDLVYAGMPWEEKVRLVRMQLQAKKSDSTIISSLDDIAWLFNLRGSDLPHLPVFKAYAFVGLNEVRLYIKPIKLTSEVEKHLCPNLNASQCVHLVDYKDAFDDIHQAVSESKNVFLPQSLSYAVISIIPEEKRMIMPEPSIVSSLKVIKNPVEIAGMKNAALKDSVAIVDFIAMLDQQVKIGKHWDEMRASKALAKYRSEQELNQGQSFETISAVGSNAAVIHYKPQVLTNRNINMKYMYLLDSGGQYLDGTTDITRTFHFGEPTEFEKEAYTRVLMGAINLISAVFPEAVKDADLDILARLPLYGVGLDYQHGTGHGIGYFLNVHEGPIGISNPNNGRVRYNLHPGMVLSDEPGYYEKDKFGIRLETMMIVIPAQTAHHFNDVKFNTFEPISFVPFEPKLINFSLLSKKQKEWLNWFNMKTRNLVGVQLQKQGRERGYQWLLSKTEHIPLDDCPNTSHRNKSYLLFIFIFFIAVQL